MDIFLSDSVDKTIKMPSVKFLLPYKLLVHIIFCDFPPFWCIET